MTTTTTTGLVPFLYSSMLYVRTSSNFEAGFNQHQILLNFVGNSITQNASNKPVSGWSAAVNDINQHVMLGSTTPCTFNAISVQGRGDTDQWVSLYRVQYTLDGITWSDYNGGTPVAGATSRNGIVTHHFNPPIIARSIKIWPQGWNNHISMRMELYGKCSGGNIPVGPTPHPMAKYLGKKVYIKSVAQDAYVRDNNSVADLSASNKRLEEWTVEDAGNNKVNFLNSQFKKYLAAVPGILDLTHADKSIPANIEFTSTELSPGKFNFKCNGGTTMRGTPGYEVQADNNTALDSEHEFEIVEV